MFTSLTSTELSSGGVTVTGKNAKIVNAIIIYAVIHNRWPTICIASSKLFFLDIDVSWVALFWILYGVGSTVFVIYLFKLGRTVASNRRELVEQEIQSIRSEKLDEAEPGLKNGQTGFADETTVNQKVQLKVQRIFRPDSDHVAVQGVLNGASRVVNLPIGQHTSVSLADSRTIAPREKIS